MGGGTSKASPSAADQRSAAVQQSLVVAAGATSTANLHRTNNNHTTNNAASAAPAPTTAVAAPSTAAAASFDQTANLIGGSGGGGAMSHPMPIGSTLPRPIPKAIPYPAGHQQLSMAVAAQAGPNGPELNASASPAPPASGLGLLCLDESPRLSTPAVSGPAPPTFAPKQRVRRLNSHGSSGGETPPDPFDPSSEEVTPPRPHRLVGRTIMIAADHPSVGSVGELRNGGRTLRFPGPNGGDATIPPVTPLQALKPAINSVVDAQNAASGGVVLNTSHPIALSFGYASASPKHGGGGGSNSTAAPLPLGTLTAATLSRLRATQSSSPVAATANSPGGRTTAGGGGGPRGPVSTSTRGAVASKRFGFGFGVGAGGGATGSGAADSMAISTATTSTASSISSSPVIGPIQPGGGGGGAPSSNHQHHNNASGNGGASHGASTPTTSGAGSSAHVSLSPQIISPPSLSPTHLQLNQSAHATHHHHLHTHTHTHHHITTHSALPPAQHHQQQLTAVQS